MRPFAYESSIRLNNCSAKVGTKYLVLSDIEGHKERYSLDKNLKLFLTVINNSSRPESWKLSIVFQVTSNIKAGYSWTPYDYFDEKEIDQAREALTKYYGRK